MSPDGEGTIFDISKSDTIKAKRVLFRKGKLLKVLDFEDSS